MSDVHDDLELIDLEAAAAAREIPARSRRERSARSPGTRGARRGSANGPAAEPRRAPRSRRPLLIGVLVVGVLAAAVAWGFAAYQRLDGVRTDLVTARGQLQTALSAVADGDLVGAADLLEDARATFATVPDRVGSPVLAPVALVPSASRTLDAVIDLSAGAEIVAAAGLSVTQVLGAEADGMGALRPRDGRIPVDLFSQLGPVLAAAGQDIRRAEALAAGVPRTGIHPAVRAARDEFIALIGPAAAQVDAAEGLVGVIPSLFGAEGPRRYMVVAANPTEARGSGGFFGAFTILGAEDGEMSFSGVRPTQDLPVLPRGRIPWPDDSLEQRYDVYGGTGFILNLNMTPDFPSAATALENFYAEATGETIDGVIAVDPFAFESLLRIAGPVQVPGYGPVGPDEVVEFVAHDAYTVITDPEERKGLIGLVATASLQGFLSSPDGVTSADVVGALGEMVSRQSIMIHAADPDEQAVLERLGAAGRLGPPDVGDYVGIFLNSGSPSKVDYWLQRYVRYDVTLGPSGLAVGTLSTGFSNGAPTEGEPGYMIGTGLPPLDIGDVLSFVSVYCAPGCRFYAAPESGFDGLVTERGEELGHPVTSTWMRLPSAQSRELIWSYLTPGAWQTRGLDRVYRLHYGHQTTILPTELDIRVTVPEGFAPTGLPEGAVVEDDLVILHEVVTTDRDIEVVFSPTG